MSLLEGQIKRQIAAGFRGKLPKGLALAPAGATTDANGDNVDTYTEYTVFGLVDSYSAFTRRTAGIPDENMRVTLIAGLCKREPVNGHLLYIKRQWWKLTKRSDDPAEATYVFEAVPARDPR